MQMLSLFSWLGLPRACSRSLHHNGPEQTQNQPCLGSLWPVYSWALICRCWAYFLGLGSPMHAVDHSTTMAQNGPRISPVQVHNALFIVEPWYADVELIFFGRGSPMHAVDHSTTMAQNGPRISPVQVHNALFIVEPWYADVELIFLAWAPPCMQ